MKERFKTFTKAIAIMLLAAVGAGTLHGGLASDDHFGVGVGVFGLLGAFFLYRAWFRHWSNLSQPSEGMKVAIAAIVILAFYWTAQAQQLRVLNNIDSNLASAVGHLEDAVTHLTSIETNTDRIAQP
jgi:hypothetical protein